MSVGGKLFLIWKVAKILKKNNWPFANKNIWNMRKKFYLDSLKIVEAFAFWICRNVQKVKVKKFSVENIPYNVFKWHRYLHIA